MISFRRFSANYRSLYVGPLNAGGSGWLSGPRATVKRRRTQLLHVLLWDATAPYRTAWQGTFRRRPRLPCGYTVPQNRIPDIIYCDLKKGDQILIIVCTNIPDTTGHEKTVQVSTSPNVCFCTTCRIRKAKYALRWIKKSVNFIFPHLRPSFRSITMFAVSCSSESTRRRLGMLMNSRSDWLKSGAEHYKHCYQRMDKASVCSSSHKGPIF